MIEDKVSNYERALSAGLGVVLVCLVCVLLVPLTWNIPMADVIGSLAVVVGGVLGWVFAQKIRDFIVS